MTAGPGAVVEHAGCGRSLRAALVLSLVWLGILTLWWALDAAPWIVAAMLAATLPAALDFATSRPAWLRLDADGITWRSGRQSGEVALPRIERVRFETRLDLSVRVRLVLHGGRRITLPQDSLPDWQTLQAGFESHGLRTERHHFGLL